MVKQRSPRLALVQLVYLLVSCLVLGAMLALPRNYDWLTTTVRHFYEQRQTLGEQMGKESRMRKGYGTAYTYTTLIKQQGKPNDYLLIPPQRYLIRNAYKQGAADGFVWLYPSVLYYHLGQSIHLLEMTTLDAMRQRATYTLWVTNGRLELLRLTDRNRAAVLDTFGKYDPHFFAYTPAQAKRYYSKR
ncbi:hypothetical protein M0L20_18465 [Spirosoma sp. RP8]|uniref:Uncharacterized protein n=1 Tax=Spirosoma liriopis TaxID=2937440 RepID=A0ABT0HP03_9BACT|nr:hypothetical protein [Spirosoma liriopis]MCK8493857.1 hypothetical protein [Spirosoma liriopis]